MVLFIPGGWPWDFSHQQYEVRERWMEPLGWVANSTMPQESSHNLQMDVSENSGTPKSSISIGFSIINHPFWGTPIFGNTQINTVNLSKGKHHQPSFSRIPAYHWNIFPIFTGNISSFSVGPQGVNVWQQRQDFVRMTTPTFRSSIWLKDWELGCQQNLSNLPSGRLT